MAEHPSPSWARSAGVATALGGLRLFLLFVATTLDHWLPLGFNLTSAEVNERRVPVVDLAARLSNWDATHYLRLAEHGYEAGERTAAFYPLYPMLVRALSTVLDPLVGALALSNLLFVAGIAFLHRWASLRDGPERADRFVLLLAAFPGAIFFGLAYSESLFLALTGGLFLALHERRWGWVGLCALLLATSRAQGVVAVVPLAWAAYEAKEREAWLAPLGSLLGFAAYLGVMAAATGSAWSGFAAQEQFINHSSPLALVDLPRFARALFHIDGLHGVTGSAIDRLVFLAWAATLVGLWRRDRTLFLWSAALGWGSAAGVGLMAFTRYAAVLAPSFWIAAEALEPEGADQPRTTFFALVGLSLVVQVLFFLRYLAHYWV